MVTPAWQSRAGKPISNSLMCWNRRALSSWSTSRVDSRRYRSSGQSWEVPSKLHTLM